jgi:tRNA-specific 2-thiouridylase
MGIGLGNIRVPITFTIGQRKGLNVGGTTEPLFIINKCGANTIYTGLVSRII